ncbi:GNAT family N-acetyltransferase [Deinococcus radiophilus]|uniref:GNAT family N-acetyltransferase n=1 Tax=Deinococcus radiophilus TaxID=32062 RepID=UPI00361851A2
MLSVRKSAQGRGYGRTLLRHALRQAEAVVVRKILQATFEDSVAASSLTQG